MLDLSLRPIAASRLYPSIAESSESLMSVFVPLMYCYCSYSGYPETTRNGGGAYFLVSTLFIIIIFLCCFLSPPSTWAASPDAMLDEESIEYRRT